MRFDVNVLETLGALLLVKGGMAERAAATVAAPVSYTHLTLPTNREV